MSRSRFVNCAQPTGGDDAKTACLGAYSSAYAAAFDPAYSAAKASAETQAVSEVHDSTQAMAQKSLYQASYDLAYAQGLRAGVTAAASAPDKTAYAQARAGAESGALPGASQDAQAKGAGDIQARAAAQAIVEFEDAQITTNADGSLSMNVLLSNVGQPTAVGDIKVIAQSLSPSVAVEDRVAVLSSVPSEARVRIDAALGVKVLAGIQDLAPKARVTIVLPDGSAQSKDIAIQF